MKKYISFAFIIMCVNLYSQTLREQVQENTLDFGNDKLHYKSFGEGDPILIINGGPGMNSEGFEPLAKELSKSNQTIIYDQRGTGLSFLDKVDETTVTLDLMVNDIEKLRKHLHIKSWVIMGHSFGGMLASYYTSKYPDNVSALILSSSGGVDMQLFSQLNITQKLTKAQKDSLQFWNAKILAGDLTYKAKFNRGKYLAPAYLENEEYIPTIAHRLTQGNVMINSLVFQNMKNIGFDCRDKLKSFKGNVLIIQGDNDIISKDIALKSQSVFQNSELVIIANCGHYGWLDQPEIYYSKLSFFLKQQQ